MIALLSLLAWGFLFWNSQNKYCCIPFAKRGGGGGSSSTTSHTYYYYRIKFAHTCIDPSQSIIFYDAFGEEVYTLPPNYEFMNYGEGVLSVPGTEQNSIVEGVASATYYVYYSTDDLLIDYEKAEFKIAKKLIKIPAQSKVAGTFEYITVLTPLRDVASVIDGKWDTQVQTVFYAQPPEGYNYAILDLGSIKTIQALDIIAGFFKPDNYRKYDLDMKLSLQYSVNGTDYYSISDETQNFQMSGGDSKSFEEEDLGIGFQARFLKLIIENLKKLDYSSDKMTVTEENRTNLIANGIISSNVANGTQIVIRDGVYVAAFTEVAAYDDIVLESESTLIPTTYLTSNVYTTGDSANTHRTLYVESTEGFELSSGETSKTAYIQDVFGDFYLFTYTDTTPTSFLGVTGVTTDHYIDDMVVQEQESDTSLYDYDGLLPHLGDRLYKSINIDDNKLYEQSQLDYLSKEYLREYYKNHSKINVEVLFAPHLKVGDTVQVVDTYQGINRNYFIESISSNNGFYTLLLAYYPE